VLVIDSLAYSDVGKKVLYRLLLARLNYLFDLLFKKFFRSLWPNLFRKAFMSFHCNFEKPFFPEMIALIVEILRVGGSTPFPEWRVAKRKNLPHLCFAPSKLESKKFEGQKRRERMLSFILVYLIEKII